MKRIIIIICIIVLVGAGLYLGRHYIFKSIEPAPTVTNQPETGIVTETTEPDDTADVLTMLADIQVFDYWVDFSDRSVYAITDGGTLYRVPAGGAPQELYSAGSKDVSAIQASPKGASVLVESGDRQSPFFSILNPVDRSNKFLPIGAEAAAWSPDGKEVVFLKDRALNIFTVATGKSRFVSSLNMTDVLLDWKKAREIYIGSRPGAGIAGQWWTYSLDKKTLLPLTEELPGLVMRWTADGQNALQFTGKPDAQNNTISFIKTNSPAVSLHVATLPEKCTPAGATVYCGEFTGADVTTLPDAYYQHVYTADNIVRINTTGFSSKKVIYFAENTTTALDIYHPIVVGPFLYFLNRNDNKIYSLVL